MQLFLHEKHAFENDAEIRIMGLGGDTCIELWDGSFTEISCACRGMVVKVASGGEAVIECVLKTCYTKGYHDGDTFCICDLEKLCSGIPSKQKKTNRGKLRVVMSAWHPLLLPSRLKPNSDRFVFARDEATAKMGDVDDFEYVMTYDLVLSTHTSRFVSLGGGVYAATFGHNVTHNTVVAHPFFGTDKVIHALKRFSSYTRNGHVALNCGQYIRDPVMGTVNGIQSHERSKWKANCSVQ